MTTANAQAIIYHIKATRSLPAVPTVGEQYEFLDEHKQFFLDLVIYQGLFATFDDKDRDFFLSDDQNEQIEAIHALFSFDPEKGFIFPVSEHLKTKAYVRFFDNFKIKNTSGYSTTHPTIEDVIFEAIKQDIRSVFKPLLVKKGVFDERGYRKCLFKDAFYLKQWVKHGGGFSSFAYFTDPLETLVTDQSYRPLPPNSNIFYSQQNYICVGWNDDRVMINKPLFHPLLKGKDVNTEESVKKNLLTYLEAIQRKVNDYYEPTNEK